MTKSRKVYLVGGGIASLAAAAFLIRDADMAGEDIYILEEKGLLGGSLDGSGNPQSGYVIRGGRMFTYEAYTCTFDLLSTIPSLRDAGKSVTAEIHAFNESNRSHARARLIRGGRIADTSSLGLSNRDRREIVELMLETEDALGNKRIVDHFSPEFLKGNFWLMWATTFAFQPWHSAAECRRYMHRFIQEFPRLATLGGVKRTAYNQYDSIVHPLTTWLTKHGVHFETDTRVTDLDFVRGSDGKAVERIHCVSHGNAAEIVVASNDLVLVTNGSMTAASRLGATDMPAQLGGKEDDGAWTLWERLAAANPEFGNPAAFDGNTAESKWLSFTATLHDPAFFRQMEAFTGNAAGTGGLVTFADSNWLMSIVLAHQPHFVGQPQDCYVFWGYGLFTEEPGNFVAKRMSECTGAEIMTELRGHLPKGVDLSPHAGATCIPCMMPFITAQFMPRRPGDRPAIRPAGTRNFAFIGQFCEMADDVVFTVEYSVRSAQTAVYELLNIAKPIPPLFQGMKDPRVLFGTLEALFS